MKQTIFTFAIALFVCATVACSSKKAVNDSSVPVLMPMAPTGGNQTVQDSIGRSPSVAIEGKLLLQSDIPSPLSNIQVGLYKEKDSKWVEVTRFSTQVGGRFAVTQKLTNGKYQLKILDKKYMGTMIVTLENLPARDLILYAIKK